MAYTLSLGGYDPKDVHRGPFVPFPVSLLSNKAVEQSDLTAGNDAAGLHTDGKIANLGIVAAIEIWGKVRNVSGSTTSSYSQSVPDYAQVEVAAPGTMLEFPYNTDETPAKGDRVVLASKASAAGKVAKAPKASLDTVLSQATHAVTKAINNNYVFDIDTTNNKVKVFFLGWGATK